MKSEDLSIVILIMAMFVIGIFGAFVDVYYGNQEHTGRITIKDIETTGSYAFSPIQDSTGKIWLIEKPFIINHLKINSTYDVVYQKWPLWNDPMIIRATEVTT